MADAEAFSGKMGDLQKLRVSVVILLSQENSKLLSRRQRVAGKEIEVMCAERDLDEGRDIPADQLQLDALYAEENVLRQELAQTELEIEKMQALMAKIDADIQALCQS
ncbi:MAG: hypothetical protein ACOH2H_17395 [Cypionkella sp.]